MVRPTKPAVLTPAVFHVLLALADGSKHGYAIMQEVEEHTAAHIRMGPGTLYGSLERLLIARLVEECAAPPNQSESNRRRRYYCLTNSGRLALQEETERLSKAVAHARRKGVLKVARS